MALDTNDHTISCDQIAHLIRKYLDDEGLAVLQATALHSKPGPRAQEWQWQRTILVELQRIYEDIYEHSSRHHSPLSEGTMSRFRRDINVVVEKVHSIEKELGMDRLELEVGLETANSFET